MCWHWHLNLFALRSRFFPQTDEIHSSSGDVSLDSNMFYSEMTSFFSLHWRSCEAETRLRAQRECVCVCVCVELSTRRIFSFLKSSTVCASGDFFPNFCEPETSSHILNPPTHTYTDSHQLSASHMGQTTWTHMPACPSKTLRRALWKFPQTASRLLTSCLLSMSIFPSISPNVSPHPPIPPLSSSLSLCECGTGTRISAWQIKNFCVCASAIIKCGRKRDWRRQRRR